MKFSDEQCFNSACERGSKKKNEKGLTVEFSICKGYEKCGVAYLSYNRGDDIYYDQKVAHISVLSGLSMIRTYIHAGYDQIKDDIHSLVDDIIRDEHLFLVKQAHEEEAAAQAEHNKQIELAEKLIERYNNGTL